MQIKLKDVKFTFNLKSSWEFQALHGIDFEVNQGEYVGIIGQTGSGKTTLIEHLNALLMPTTGTVEWIYKDEVFDKATKTKKEVVVTDVIGLKKVRKFKKVKQIRKRIGVVFQFAEYQLFKATVLEDIIFGPVSYGMDPKEAEEKAKKYIKLVGLPEEYLKRSPFDLSGGQKRRVALTGILAMEPDVLVVDEPTAGLDPWGVKEILDILTHLHESGKTIINVTHDLDHVLERAKRVIVLKNGKIIKDGQPYETLNDIAFLEENNLQPPKLLNFVNKLRAKGVNVPKVTSEAELVSWINDYMETKNKKEVSNE